MNALIAETAFRLDSHGMVDMQLATGSDVELPSAGKRGRSPRRSWVVRTQKLKVPADLEAVIRRVAGDAVSYRALAHAVWEIDEPSRAPAFIARRRSARARCRCPRPRQQRANRIQVMMNERSRWQHFVFPHSRVQPQL